jgi:hypothetical protein
MARLAKRRVAICAIAAMAVLSGAAAMVAPTALSPTRDVDSLAGRTSRQDLVPAAMRAALAEPDIQLVAVVAADIDADGDLDVIASDSALHLYVWVNDGAGHLRRVPPSRSSSLQPDPPGPTIEHGTAPSPVPPPKERSVHLGADADPAARAYVRLLTTAPSDALLRPTLATHTPRAPPISPVLT